MHEVRVLRVGRHRYSARNAVRLAGDEGRSHDTQTEKSGGGTQLPDLPVWESSHLGVTDAHARSPLLDGGTRGPNPHVARSWWRFRSPDGIPTCGRPVGILSGWPEPRSRERA